MNLELNEEINLTVRVQLIQKGSDKPMTDSSITVRLYDKDLFNDDFLGESKLDANGHAEISITQKQFSDLLSLEEKPDFYFTVLKDKEIIFKSKIMEDLELSSLEKFEMGKGEIIDLGSFLI